MQALDLEPYRKSMNRLALRLLKKEHLAQDAVQGAFFSILNSRKPFRGEASLETYVHRAVYTKAIDILRREAKEWSDSLLVEGVLGNQIDPSFMGRTPEELLIASEQVAALAEALRSLSKVQQKAFKTILIDEVKPSEAAKILGVHPGTLRIQLHRAKKKLRERLEKVA